MASKGSVVLRGRFPKGSIVRLVKVAGEHVLRSQGGEEIDVQEVKDEDGIATVKFTKGVEVGARYFITGLVDGFPLELRATGKASDDPDAALGQAPIQPDRVRLTDGSFLDEAPTKESAPPAFVGPGPGQHQVPKGVVQRSDTPRGSAHPLDPDEAAPKRRQEDVPEGTVQMSDTRDVEVDGRKVSQQEAAELVLGPQRQEDVGKGVLQRSSTPTGVATPIPTGDAVKAQQVRESSFAKEARSEPVRAAAEPVEKAKAPSGASGDESAKRDAELRKSENEAPAKIAEIRAESDPQLSGADGRDAQGQPLDAGVAAGAGIASADSPSEPVRKSAPKRSSSKRSSSKSKSSASGSRSKSSASSASTTAKAPERAPSKEN